MSGETVLSAVDGERFGSSPAASFARNLASVRARIAAACARSGRAVEGVRLMIVTKTVPAPILRLAHHAGLSDIGENKLQEARDKHGLLADLPIRWSIIGHLQTNKVKYLVRFASEFHALDSLRLADALNRRLEAEGRDLDVFVQVNTSGEPSKFGLAADDLTPFVERLADFPRLRPRGLMTLALFSADADRVRPCFRLLRALRDQAATVDERLAGLSMGMSGDYEIAIEEGATVVRVGQAIFGARPGGDAHYWPGLIPPGNAGGHPDGSRDRGG
ncbi:YggS family pyridoxal phosphate-dependent enzyme [Sphingobium cloacae]|uniref:Pyridoxal phosphate homeostasis protein n=1 Tax=Sphingobium cloacae TaxID=120107 RepID=A0A1E1EY96_9SPHN|nr:YggS family pyridoxal phosphate-dependent enzyme [Sphingobium cloacae]BAV63229.1 YggS family pyridoxal phosphate enzyme [Sphingobium cloacae]